ncbi:MAG: hypothetical protein KAY24_08010 [Candidatus Eisenbacteria sp.]|nr:hypothetical protein [Candidatus Eisenbacteria bacterium]
MYLVLFVVVAGISILTHGLPPLEDWHSAWLPTTLGPALFVGLYCLVAQRRARDQP